MTGTAQHTPLNKIQVNNAPPSSVVQHASLTKLHKKVHRHSLPQQLIPHTPSKPKRYSYDFGFAKPITKKFLTLRELGEGNFSQVFLVEIEGDLWALKRIPLQNVRYEVDIMRQLKHPNTVQYQDSWSDQLYQYIQLKYYERGVITGKNVNVVELLKDLGQALEYIHKFSIIHMDIKPSNIFIDDRSFVLGDFGLAVYQKGLSTEDEVQEGDVRYMAPELLTNNYSTAADVFSLGIVCVEILTDVHLPQMGEAWHQLRSGNGQIWQELCHAESRQLQLLIDAMIQPLPQNRPTASQILEIIK